MKKKRPDGTYIENINPYTKLMPHIMPHRYDAQNMCKIDVRCDGIDAFIKEQSLLGNKFSYNDILIASIVRLFAKRPSINRFVKNRRIYQHNDITVSFVVKKKMLDESEDTTVKLHFSGEENIHQVKEALAKIIAENTGDAVYNNVDKTAKFLTSAPHWLIRFFVGILNFLDNRNILPKSIVEVSPFHNSIFITFLKSIKGEWLLHHCYEFGTTGIFIGVGKEKTVPVVECGEIKAARVMEMGIVMDERFCDGLYFVNSMRLWQNILRDPSCLLENYDLTSENRADNGIITKADKRRYKIIARQQRRQRKNKNTKN